MELLTGEAAAPAVVEHKLQGHFRLLGPQGLTGIAMAGIDMALWDVRARACGVPLVTVLGGEPKPIPAYASLHYGLLIHERLDSCHFSRLIPTMKIG
jgi:mandelate racemase